VAKTEEAITTKDMKEGITRFSFVSFVVKDVDTVCNPLEPSLFRLVLYSLDACHRTISNRALR
jgi:hypothetical protein